MSAGMDCTCLSAKRSMEVRSRPAVGGRGNALRNSSCVSGRVLKFATQSSISPSQPIERPVTTAAQRSALATIASNTAGDRSASWR